MRERTGRGNKIPYFDPCDGGVSARCLYLLEAPGPQAVVSGFVSRNNPDESARNFFELNQEAGIPRTLTATWNIVPWYIGSGTKIRPAQKSDLEEGMWYLHRVFQYLPSLRIVVLMGQKATFAESHIRSMNRTIEIFRSPHPSPLYVNNHPGNRSKILDAFGDVASHLQSVDTPTAGLQVCWVPLQGAQDMSDYDEIVWVSISKIDASWRMNGDYVGTGGSGRVISGRYEKAGVRFKDGKPMWIPMVCLDRKQEISFTDGRHRFAWLRDHGVEAIPLQVPPDQAKMIVTRFGTTTRESSFRLNA